MRAGETPMPKRAVSYHGYAMLFAPWQHMVFDGSLFQMIENLIARHAVFASDGRDFFKIWHVEVAHAPGNDLSLLLQLLESANRTLQRMRSAPMQEIAIQTIGLETSKGVLARSYCSTP